ncbi:unnamed protein product [Urochloa humidicola]
MIPQARTRDSMEGIRVDTANTLLVILLHLVHILPDQGIRSHLVGTRLRVATLNLVDTRRLMVLIHQVLILQADIPINLATHPPVTLVMVQ